MEQKGKLVVISGFSGAGKGTLMKALLAAHPDRYALSVSATTRDPRPGEKDGVDYFFVTDETFDSMIQKDDFLEYAKYVSHSYGTPRSYVEENLNLGKNVILEIEIQGALKVKEKIKDTPILLLDDVLSELDRNRQNYLLENIKGIQTIITCTGLEEFVKNGININQTFEIVQGKINGN